MAAAAEKMIRENPGVKGVEITQALSKERKEIAVGDGTAIMYE